MLLNFNEYNLISIINKFHISRYPVSKQNYKDLKFLTVSSMDDQTACRFLERSSDAPNFSLWIYIGNRRLRAVFSGKTHSLRKNLDFASNLPYEGTKSFCFHPCRETLDFGEKKRDQKICFGRSYQWVLDGMARHVCTR